MKRFSFIFIAFLGTFASAQERIYIDLHGNKVPKERAELYREVQKKDSLYEIKDFFLSGKLQMVGYSKNPEMTSTDMLLGKFFTYHENGKVKIEGFRENELYFHYKEFDENGKFIAESERNEQGTTLKSTAGKYSSFDELIFTNNDNSVIKRVSYDKDITKIRMESLSSENGNTITHFYDEKGKLIGTNTFDENFASNGTEVSFYKNPMRVASIRKMEKGKNISEEIFYGNGKRFSLSELKEDQKITLYFNEKGKEIGKLIEKKQDDIFFTPQSGNMLSLSEDGKFVESDTEYKLGMRTKSVSFYENGKTKSITDYNIENWVGKITYFDNKGKEQEKIIYEDGQPFDGKYYDDFGKNPSFTAYKEGKMVEMQTFDEQKRLRFVKKHQPNSEYSYDCEVFNEKQEKIYSYSINQDNETMEIHQFENGKQIHKAFVREGILVEGSVKLFDTERKIDILLKAEGAWIIVKTYQENELVKDSKVLATYTGTDSYAYEYLIREDSLYKDIYDAPNVAY